MPNCDPYACDTPHHQEDTVAYHIIIDLVHLVFCSIFQVKLIRTRSLSWLCSGK